MTRGRSISAAVLAAIAIALTLWGIFGKQIPETGILPLVAIALALPFVVAAVLVVLSARGRRQLTAIVHGVLGVTWLLSEAGQWLTPPILFRLVLPGLLCIASLAFWPWRDPIPRRTWWVGISLDVLMLGLWLSQVL